MEFGKLSVEAQNIVLFVENTHHIANRVTNLVECLIEKREKGVQLSQEHLENSSVFKQICTLGVKELIKANPHYKNKIKKENRDEFKKYYSERLISRVEVMF